MKTKHLILLLVIVSFSVVLFYCEHTPEKPQSEKNEEEAPYSDRTGGIHGYVTYKETGKPVVNAIVHVTGINRSVNADENGYYLITNLAPGFYNLYLEIENTDDEYIHYRATSKDWIPVVSEVITTENFEIEIVYYIIEYWGTTRKLIDRKSGSSQHVIDVDLLY